MANSSNAQAAAAAIHAGDLRRLEQLLTEHLELVNSRVDGQRTLLHVATDWPGHFPNNPEIVACLLGHGAEVNARFHGRHSETPLHWAASCDDVAVLDVLLDHGADIEAGGGVIANGTPLADAVAFAQWNAARRLIERGAVANLWQAAALGLMARVESFFLSDSPPVSWPDYECVLVRMPRRPARNSRASTRPRCRRELDRLRRADAARRRSPQRQRSAHQVVAQHRSEARKSLKSRIASTRSRILLGAWLPTWLRSVGSEPRKRRRTSRFGALSLRGTARIHCSRS